MIVNTGTVTITDDEIVASGFTFTPPMNVDSQNEAIQWAIQRLQSLRYGSANYAEWR